MGDLSHERFPLFDVDPRTGLTDEALDKASRNAFPVVAGDARRKDRGGLLLGVTIAALLGAVTFTGLRSAPAPRSGAGAPDRSSGTAATAQPTDPEQPDRGQAEPALAVQAMPPTPAQAAVLAQPPGQAAGFPAPAVAPVMVYDTSSLAEPAGPSAAVRAAAGPAPGQAGPLSENEAFGSRLATTGGEIASATRMADPTNTVTQGTLIPAILETAIDSDLPGYVRAVVSVDVKSFDGRRVLVPRSSRLIGQYKSGLAAGQTRAYVIWTRLIRPDGVSVALASPAVEFSGRSGLSGEVSGHFFKRFGAASLLSVIGGLGAIASGGAAGLLITSNSQSAASVAAQRDAQIPPTIRVAQGQPVRVFTARDLDFSGVAP
ncbi:TrbI/VirB10 family protein [Novosphingobium piscinae]|uniref:Type VI secretion protein n=1 Tax=Novosphingobium piscinae TaxID=1507448 RepID=A0A7X1KQY3_9SPHN|nr:TrbI/VirB10 family protein [Novosphingobium piscinae]MBC2670196.1 type VI secretion protein [Novosphingobium piscinae]